jgi:hypothetical protein
MSLSQDNIDVDMERERSESDVLDIYRRSITERNEMEQVQLLQYISDKSQY